MFSRCAILATACLLFGTLPVHSEGLEAPSDPAKARLECFEYLKAYLPPRDVNLTDDWLYRMVDLALLPRTHPTMPWAGQVPWDIFLNDVLPYARWDRPTQPEVTILHDFMQVGFEVQCVLHEALRLACAAVEVVSAACVVEDPARPSCRATRKTMTNPG